MEWISLGYVNMYEFAADKYQDVELFMMLVNSQHLYKVETRYERKISMVVFLNETKTLSGKTFNATAFDGRYHLNVPSIV